MHGTQNAMAVHETIYKYNIIQSLQTRYIFLILCMHVEKKHQKCLYIYILFIQLKMNNQCN